ncbi:hypothetical protein GCM10023107_34900 [Actinoplanes octamycinicus]|nr:hypothetical protein Aoc01nite_28120 [Actinoplanes octamycinicus]
MRHTAAEMGNGFAIPGSDPLAGLLIEQGRVDEAITVLRQRADAGYRHAAEWLADLLAGQGRIDEPEEEVIAGTACRRSSGRPPGTGLSQVNQQLQDQTYL